ncbi:unnamed protein product [Owenia fusiformis]|uniref:Uncharacterized protein n=1 Tax=Owenia fusiformis TaxID=6347 RepID=A0A8J1TCA8_OWEFU|nr:unnamed protein product [Owenia fusiformis]
MRILYDKKNQLAMAGDIQTERTIDTIRGHIDAISSFLQCYIPLANTHTTDFIINKTWDKMVPVNIADELLSISSTAFIELLCDCGTETSSSPIAPFTKPAEECIRDSVARKLSKNEQPKWVHSNLKSFLQTLQGLTLPRLNVLTDIEELTEYLAEDQKQDIFIRNFMSAKKSHEVELMANLCSLLASHVGTDKVIDIGSGKGYLSAQLSLMYNLHVLGIDSSTGNTHGANDRAGKLSKYWNGLVRNATEDATLNGKPVKRGKKYKKRLKKQREFDATVDKAGQTDDFDITNKINTSCAITDESNKPLRTENYLLEHQTDVQDQGESMAQSYKDKPDKSHKEVYDKAKTNIARAKENRTTFIPLTMWIDTDTDLEQLVMDHLSTKEDNSTAIQSGSPHFKNDNAFDDISNCVSPNVKTASSAANDDIPHAASDDLHAYTNSMPHSTSIDIPHAADNDIPLVAINGFPLTAINSVQHAPTKTASNASLSYHIPQSSINDIQHAATDVALTGLHTCGNLATSMLKLFVANQSARTVCNVGCCYHHLDEQFVISPFSKDGETHDPSKAGFPMSAFLREQCIRLGRNARMTACQAIDRISAEQKTPQKSLFWRALLQVILSDLTAEKRDDWHVGKVASKCSDFSEYVIKSCKKLGIDSTKLTPTAIEGYVNKYKDQEAKLNSFFLLKAALGPVIEGYILLDRLLYLMEHKINVVHLVQLFDPVTSPRCYAIIGIKDKRT